MSQRIFVLLISLVLTQAACTGPGASPGSTPAGGVMSFGAGGGTVTDGSKTDSTDGELDPADGNADPNGFRVPTIAGVASEIRSSGAVAMAGDPNFLYPHVAKGQQVTNCRASTDLKIHLSGRVGSLSMYGFGVPFNPDDVGPEEVSNASYYDLGYQRLRVIYPTSPNGSFYYRDFSFLTALPDQGSRMVMKPVNGIQFLPPRIYFDFDVVTSDPDHLRLVIFKHNQEISGTTETACLSTSCLDGTSMATQILNRLDVSNPDHVPLCIEPKIEIEKVENNRLIQQ